MTTHQPCEYDQYCTVTMNACQTQVKIYQILNPREDERKLLMRNLNKWIKGEPPCQCEKCSTQIARKLGLDSPIEREETV